MEESRNERKKLGLNQECALMNKVRSQNGVMMASVAPCCFPSEPCMINGNDVTFTCAHDLDYQQNFVEEGERDFFNNSPHALPTAL